MFTLRRETLLLLGILLLAFVLRLYRFDNPVADWHSWRQADTSAVSRNFIKFGFDVPHPRFDDLSNVPSGKDNPYGYRFVEFPLYNLAQAGLSTLGIFSIEEWGRLVTIFSSLFSILFLFLIIKKHHSLSVGLLTAFFYAVIPYSIYYGRVILPDPSMVMATLGAIYFFDKWTEKSSKYWNYFVLSLLFAISALLLKPYAIFFMLPMGYLAWEKFGLGVLKKWQLYLFAVLAIAPLVWWRMWINQFPEGIPANTWLLNGNGIRFRPSFFRWILYERLTKLISGYVGIIPLIAGAIAILKIKERGFFLSFLIASILYVCIFATGNVQHDYYQILIFPTIAIYMAIGTIFLFQLLRKYINITLCSLLFALCSLLMFYFSWKEVKGYFNVNNPDMIIAGNAVDRLTPKDAKVIALLDGDTSFLYQTKRQGWASYEKDLPGMIGLGADYLVQLNPKTNEIESLSKKYKIVISSPTYMIVKLH